VNVGRGRWFVEVGHVIGVLQCVAVCCSVLQYVAVCCSVLQCVADWSLVRGSGACHRCFAVCCSVL